MYTRIYDEKNLLLSIVKSRQLLGLIAVTAALLLVLAVSTISGASAEIVSSTESQIHNNNLNGTVQVKKDDVKCEQFAQPYVDLSGCDLSFKDLFGANLTGANLAYVNLSNSNLMAANLSSANLAFANLTNANLAYANLSSTDTAGTELTGAKIIGCIGCPSPSSSSAGTQSQ